MLNNIVNLDSKGKTIVCFGNSLTAGYMVAPEYAYPARLQHWVTLPVVNHGVSGDTTYDALPRLPAALAAEPRIAIVELGINDCGWGLAVVEARPNLTRIIRAFQERGAAVVLAGFALSEVPEWAEMYRTLAEICGAVLVPDIFAGIHGRGDLVFDDGLHPNAAGYAVMAENYYRAVQPLLAYMGIDKRGNHNKSE